MISFLNNSNYLDEDFGPSETFFTDLSSSFENFEFGSEVSTIESNNTISNINDLFEKKFLNEEDEYEEFKKIFIGRDNNSSNNSSTKSSSNNDISINISLMDNKNRKDIFEVHNCENSITELVNPNKSSNNLFYRKRKKIKEKTEAKINKTEDISKPVFREFRNYLNNRYRFENNKEFWKQFFGKKTPPFSFIYKGEKKEFNSFNRNFFEFIMSVDDMYNLYENFLKDKKYQTTQKEKRRKKQKDIKKVQSYENYLNNFHILYSKEKDENYVNFEF